MSTQGTPVPFESVESIFRAHGWRLWGHWKMWAIFIYPVFPKFPPFIVCVNEDGTVPPDEWRRIEQFFP